MTARTLYLCEKPDQGKIIAKALGGGSKTQGGISGNDWIVTWAFGHLLTPFMPQDYDENLKRWEWDSLPIVPEKFRFKAKDGMSAKQLGAIRKHARSATEIIIATDADREGELIAYEILNDLGWKGSTRRLWLSDLTIPAVQKALSRIKPASETRPLYWAAAARTYADWIVGMNLSRAATLKLAARGGKPMSVGRVQTPVLTMIVDLERKIQNFKPEDYFEIRATVSAPGGSFTMRHAPPQEKRIKDRKAADALRARAEGARGPLSVKTEARKQAPPALPDLNALQQECNSRFGWSADKTLKVMQALYETHHVLTYPRTDSRALPEEHKANVPVIAGNLAGIPELGELAALLGQPQIRSSVYDDSKVTAHHAIIPTNQAARLEDLTDDESRLYLLVARFWMAVHMPDLEFLQTTILLDANGVPFRATGRQVTRSGWKAVFSGVPEGERDDKEAEQDDADAAVALPPLKDKDPATVARAEVETRTTKPPARFTEKSLLQAMKNVAAYVDDPAAKKRLKETSGIGTPATRANVIETLKAREYIKLNKRQIVPLENGFVLVDAMRAAAPSYADAATTAQWEDVLDAIATGTDPAMTKRFVAGIADLVRKDLEILKTSDLQRIAAAPASGPRTASRSRRPPPEGKVLKVPFEAREKAKAMGARWNGEKKKWVVPDNVDATPFRDAGFL